MMNDAEIEITPPGNKFVASIDNVERRELLWEKREEQLLTLWARQIEQKRSKHYKKGGLYRNLYYVFGIPGTILPLIAASLNGVLEMAPLTISACLVFSGIISGINTFVNFGKKEQQYFEFSSKYSELGISIEKELSIPKSHRVAADVFLERVQNTLNSINTNAPPI